MEPYHIPGTSVLSPSWHLMAVSRLGSPTAAVHMAAGFMNNEECVRKLIPGTLVYQVSEVLYIPGIVHESETRVFHGNPRRKRMKAHEIP